jgi:monofunctional biosynthetic peptidoglycan transglycosylase
VSGSSLEGEAVALPADLEGRPAILLAGYVQKSQFDLDRWLLGLVQAGTPVQLYEIPTVKGLVPRMISGTIDDGMRSGIPDEDWGSVVTLYGDSAERVVAITGAPKDRNGRVFLLDAEGRIVWYHDRGYSAGRMNELDAAARALVSTTEVAASASPEPAEDAVILHDFSDPAAADDWNAVDDRVMGGVSRSGMEASGEGYATFAGELSLESNGGFASVRTPPDALDLSGLDRLALRVRGDGRIYQLRLRTDESFDGVSHTTSFRTHPGEWRTLELPLDAFVPTWRGRVQPDVPPIDAASVRGMGLLVADGQEGSFELDVAWIEAR